jgi:hypothetical protein
MDPTCPKCGLISPDSAAKCDCGQFIRQQASEKLDPHTGSSENDRENVLRVGSAGGSESVDANGHGADAPSVQDLIWAYLKCRNERSYLAASLVAFGYVFPPTGTATVNGAAVALFAILPAALLATIGLLIWWGGAALFPWLLTVLEVLDALWGVPVIGPALKLFCVMWIIVPGICVGFMTPMAHGHFTRDITDHLLAWRQCLHPWLPEAVFCGAVVPSLSALFTGLFWLAPPMHDPVGRLVFATFLTLLWAILALWADAPQENGHTQQPTYLEGKEVCRWQGDMIGSSR